MACFQPHISEAGASRNAESLCKLVEEECPCGLCLHLCLPCCSSSAMLLHKQASPWWSSHYFSPSQSENHKPMLSLGTLWYFHICLTPWVEWKERGIQSNIGKNETKYETKMTFFRACHSPYLGTSIVIPFSLFILQHSCRSFFMPWHICEDGGGKIYPQGNNTVWRKGLQWKTQELWIWIPASSLSCVALGRIQLHWTSEVIIYIVSFVNYDPKYQLCRIILRCRRQCVREQFLDSAQSSAFSPTANNWSGEEVGKV